MKRKLQPKKSLKMLKLAPNESQKKDKIAKTKTIILRSQSH